jgi:hypothetical protein
VVEHSFAEESVTESSIGEKDAMVAIDGMGDVISHVRVSNRKAGQIFEFRLPLNALMSGRMWDAE